MHISNIKNHNECKCSANAMSTASIPNKVWSCIIPLLRQRTMLYLYGHGKFTTTSTNDVQCNILRSLGSRSKLATIIVWASLSLPPSCALTVAWARKLATPREVVSSSWLLPRLLAFSQARSELAGGGKKSGKQALLAFLFWTSPDS
jgi:hypothetical protein